jgi:hypothetical protein
MAKQGYLEVLLENDKAAYWKLLDSEKYQTMRELAMEFSRGLRKEVYCQVRPKTRCLLCGQVHLGEAFQVEFKNGKTTSPSSVEAVVDSCEKCVEFVEGMSAEEIVKFVLREKRKMIVRVRKDYVA